MSNSINTDVVLILFIFTVNHLVDFTKDFLRTFTLQMNLLADQHGLERVHLLSTHNQSLPYGIPAWIKHKTTDERYILGRLRISEVFHEDLETHRGRPKSKAIKEITNVHHYHNSDHFHGEYRSSSPIIERTVSETGLIAIPGDSVL